MFTVTSKLPKGTNFLISRRHMKMVLADNRNALYYAYVITARGQFSKLDTGWICTSICNSSLILLHFARIYAIQVLSGCISRAHAHHSRWAKSAVIYSLMLLLKSHFLAAVGMELFKRLENSNASNLVCRYSSKPSIGQVAHNKWVKKRQQRRTNKTKTFPNFVKYKKIKICGFRGFRASFIAAILHRQNGSSNGMMTIKMKVLIFL